MSKKVKIDVTIIRMVSGYTYYVRGTVVNNRVQLAGARLTIFRLANSNEPVTLTVAHIESMQPGRQMKVKP